MKKQTIKASNASKRPYEDEPQLSVLSNLAFWIIMIREIGLTSFANMKKQET